MKRVLRYFSILSVIVLIGMLVGCTKETYKLTFNPNGGLVENKELYILDVKKNEDSLITLPEAIRKGYDFLGWEENGLLISGNQISVDRDINLLAKWEKITYQISYNLDGGALTDSVDSYTVEDEVVLPIPTKAGYKFAGWEENITKIEKGTTGDITLSAKWEIAEYNIKYNLNGGAFASEVDSTFTSLEEVVLVNPSKMGYKFTGWTDATGNKMEKINVGTTSDVAVYANYELEKYTISYVLAGGKLTNAITTYTIEDEIVLPVPEKVGYKFIGWNDGVTSISKGTTGNITLTANWETEVYSITYHLDGGIMNNEPTKYTILDEITMPMPTKDGYRFAGWYLNSDLTGSALTKIVKGATGDLTVYACWLKDDTYTITYHLDGGTLPSYASTTYSVGKPFTLATPEKDGYIFMGWYDNFKFNGDPIKKIDASDSGDKVYYAYWDNAESMFNALIPSVITDNLTLYSTHPDNSDIKITWISSDTTLIDGNGYINPGHKTLKTNLTMNISYLGLASKFTKEVSVAPAKFASLSTGKTVVGYVYSGTYSRWGSTNFNTVFSKLALDTMDVVNYGFVTVDGDGNLKINNGGFDRYVDQVLELRKHGVRVLLCIGENAYNFSKMAYTTEGINKFVSQVMQVVEKYHFDGVDIDWEFPGVNSAYDVTIDRPNYTKLIKALRTALDNAQEAGGSPYLLTAAIPGTSWGSERYEMGVLDNYLDFVNMMSYDLNNTSIACHHTNLYTSTAARAYGFSIDYGVNRFVSMGFDKNKIVAGMAFYGKYYTNATKLGASASFNKNLHYTVIKNTYLSNSSFQQLWDESAKAPYLLNTTTGEYISYDNPRSIMEKCKYAKTNGIKGVMFWDYSEDTSRDLMQAIYDEMR